MGFWSDSVLITTRISPISSASVADIVIDYGGEPLNLAIMALLEARSRPQRRHGWDPDRCHGRPHHRAAVALRSADFPFHHRAGAVSPQAYRTWS